jgi:hypothetical protein
MDRRALIGLAAVAASAASAPSGSARAGSGGGGATTSYLRMQTLTATLVRPDGRRGVMTVEFGVDAPDGAVRSRAEHSIPRIRAACNTVVRTIASSLLPGAPPDIDRLATGLQTAVDGAVGRRGARVLLGTVMVS